jgi:hypothetical protein
LDSTRIYSRALAANEILSEAQAGNIEFETRTGADATPDDGSWEAWKPTTSESQILSLDSDSRNWDGEYDNYTKLLLHSDGADASTTFTDSSLYGKTVTANGNAHVETDMKVFGSASAQFDGTGDYLSASDSADWNMGSGDFTIDCWFYALNNNQTVFAFYGTGWSGGNMQWTLGVHSNKLFAFFDTAGTDIVLYDSVNLPTSTWTHAAFVRSGNNFNLYKNGTSVASGSTASAGNTGTYYFTSGVDYGGASYYTGYLDEVRVSKGIARWTSNFTVPNAAYENPRHGAMGLSDVSNPKAEGSGALKVSTPGSLSQADANVVGLWHMEETGGTGAYIKDATANAHNATPTGTTVVDGIYGKARYFDGNEDYLSISDSSDWNFDTSTSWNVSFWVYPTSSFSSTIFYGRSADDILNGGENYLYYQTASSPNGLSWGPINGEWDSGKTLSLNQWQYVAMIYDTDSETAYACVNGSCSSVAVSSVGSSSGNFKIGDNYNSNFFNGYIDEFKVSKGHAYSVDEVNEQYRLGRDHRVARTISSTDFSSKTKLPFYVAGDRVGTYLEATVGESAYANYLADTNQKLFLHGDENAESTAIKDSSDSAKTVTVNGDVKVKNFGKIGNSIYFDGSGDYLSLADSEDWDFGSGDFTISWWQYPTSASTSGTFGRSITTAYPAFLVLNSSVNMTSNGSSWDIANGKTLGGLTLNTWQHFAIVRNGSNFYTYKNGQVRDSWSSASALNNEAAAFVIGRYTNVLNYDYSGYLDEFGLFKGTAKTAAEIRQTYEIGKRTHPITIDFQAKLDSGNLIADTSDLSFTVDARSYLPTTNYGENLYVGDKVIVKENYDGTEYIAQGTVTAITASTGATTVAAWDAGSTAPAGGYTVNAQVFKWQREWVDVTAPLGSQVDAVTRLTLRCTDGSEGRTVYLDDFKSGGAYLTNPSATGNVTSTVQRYMQYRALFSTTDPAVTPYLSGVTVNYTSGPTNAQLMRHGKWFSSGVKQSFWWARLVPPTPN